MDVVVLDGNQRSSLAVTRSLGKRGIKVIVGAESVPSLSSSSKYCRRSFLYPSPSSNPDHFFETLKKYVAQKTNLLLLPMTDVTLGEILRRRNDLGENIIIPFADYDIYDSASDKVNILTIARDLDIPMPRTLFPSTFKDRESLVERAGEFGFPVVVKPNRSRERDEGKWIDTTVRFAQDQHELNNILNEELFKRFPFIIQEKICGAGIGIFVLIREGQVLAQFAHRRIREKPPSGGVSVLCESIEPPPVALDAAKKLLKYLGWSGVAMVEFKEDIADDNTPKLMEVNARFWGSLQLAISAGVDFPHLLYCLARKDKIEPPKRYKIGVMSRWELGDLDHLLIRHKATSKILLQYNAPSRMGAIKSFLLDFLRPCVRNEILWRDDMRPFRFELKKYLKSFI
jgi:predicted ATP-grasp superfamily ATP-dependent carboligase